MELSGNEQKLINILRGLKPFERVEIMADGEGKPGCYVVSQSTKRMLLIEKEVFVQQKFAAHSSF